MKDGEFVVTSPQTRSYNCIAWAAGEDIRWWWPDSMNQAYWPLGVPREETIDAFILAYQSCGYDICADGEYEQDFEKIAIYARQDFLGNLAPTHAARQIDKTWWTSKMGPQEDISHVSPEALAGPEYGKPALFMKRPKAT